MPRGIENCSGLGVRELLFPPSTPFISLLLPHLLTHAYASFSRTIPKLVPRFGVLFFLLLYLSLLSLTSLPVWREDRRLFLTEMMGGAYGHFPYFTSVALADILLVRVVPPLAFAVLAYPLLGLNDERDNNWCLVWFTSILVRGRLLWAWEMGVTKDLE